MRIRILIAVVVAAAFVAFVLARPRPASRLDDTEYFVPLVGGVGIHRICDGPGDPEAGTYVEYLKRPSATILSVGNVQEVAVVGSIIVGTADAGRKYFLFDTASPASLRNDAEVYSDRESWIHAMNHAGIKEIPRLATTAQLASCVPDQILHANDYRRVHGRFGWNDHVWSDNILIGSMVFLFLLGFLLPGPYPLVRLIASIVLGLVVCVYCEVGIGGDTGPFGLAEIPVLWGMGWFGSYCGRRILPTRSAR